MIKRIIIQGVQVPKKCMDRFCVGIAFSGGVDMFISTIFGKKEHKKKRDLFGLAFYL